MTTMMTSTKIETMAPLSMAQASMSRPELKALPMVPITKAPPKCHLRVLLARARVRVRQGMEATIDDELPHRQRRQRSPPLSHL